VTSCLQRTREGPILRLTLCRSEKRNALSDEMAGEFEDAVRSMERECRVIVIHGDGPHFCAGLDLNEQRDRDPIDVVKISRRWHAIKDSLQFGKCPVIAAVHGGAIGGGFELAVTAHVRIADRTAYFQLPEGKRGIFIGGGGSVRIAKTIGISRITEIMLTGRRILAEEAERVGIVHTLVDSGKVLDAAMQTAQTIAGNAEFVNYLIMHALPRISDMSAAEGLFTESLAAGLSQASEDARARVDGFLKDGVRDPLEGESGQPE